MRSLVPSIRKPGSLVAALCVAALAAACQDQPTGVTDDPGILLKKSGGCATIQGGKLLASTGETITITRDEFGYSYQAHIFNGVYSDVDRVHGGDFSDVNLQMKWNDAWLSNKSCDGNDVLDRHYGYDSYIGSGAWLTNHDIGFNEAGNRWTYFVKIVAAPADAYKDGDTWYTADDTEIGPVIWGAFAVIQQVVTGEIPSDFVAGDEMPLGGSAYRSPAGSGLGAYKP